MDESELTMEVQYRHWSPLIGHKAPCDPDQGARSMKRMVFALTGEK